MKQALALLLVLVLCVPALAGEAPFLGVDDVDAFDPADRNPGRLERLAGVAPAFLRTAPIPWGRLQPARPTGGAAVYQWEALDEAILLWQLSGFEPVPVLSPRSPWATVAAKETAWHKRVAAVLPAAEAAAALRTATGCSPPRIDTWPLWERFVRAVVERYDGDGKGDAPGLRRPVRHIQILRHVTHADAWLGSPDEYMRLLHHAGLGAKAASPETQVVTAALDLRATGHEPYPDTTEWDYRIGRLVSESGPLAVLEAERAFAFARRLLESPTLYDAASHVGSDHHADDGSNVRFVRRYLDEHGGKDVALWLVDNTTRKLGQARSPKAVPTQFDERRVRRRWVPAALNPTHSEHGKALAWLRRGQAFDLVRSACLARAAGADVVCLLAAWDRRRKGGARRGGQGFVAEVEDGPPTQALRRTPSWYALRQATRLLSGHQSAAASALGAPGRAVVFSFESKRARPWVSVLLLDPRLSWAGAPGQPLPARAVTVPLPDGRYVLESCRLGEAEPRRREVTVRAGMLDIELTPAPLYVIPLK